jgi:transcription antitermination factor NusG
MDIQAHSDDGHGIPLNWYVVRVRANAERKVAQILGNHDIDVFLPLQKRPSRRRNLGLIETPLFPGYIFARFDRRRHLPVVSCPGVVNILCRGRVPEPVDSSEMFALQTVSHKARSLTPMAALPSGSKVRIAAGPLADVEAIVLRDNGRQRIVVSVSLLQRSVEAEVEREWVDGYIAQEVM